MQSLDTPSACETILVVEDSELIREFACTILANKGYKVIEARSCSEAIGKYEKHKGTIKLLLTDVVMPRMSGRDLARILTLAHPGLKIIYMSGYSEQVAGQAGHVESQAAFLQKPFTADALWAKVAEVLGH